jgi:hypothetical protein
MTSEIFPRNFSTLSPNIRLLVKYIFIIIALSTLIERIFFVLNVQMIEMGGMEINVLYGAIRILEGQPLYQNAAEFPFSVMQYPPLHYYILAKFVAFFNSTPDIQCFYFYNRILSLGSNIGLCIVIFCFLESKKIPRLDCFFWISVVFVTATMPYMSRMDAMYSLFFVLFSWSSLLFYEPKTERTRTENISILHKNNSGFDTKNLYYKLFLNAFLIVLLCLTKQNAYGLVIVHFFIFIKIIGWRNTLLWLVFSTLIYAILFKMMVNDAYFFYQNTVLGLYCAFAIQATLVTFCTNKHFITLFPVLFGTMFCLYKAYLTRAHYYIITLTYVLFFSIIGVFKMGSGVNYFAEITILTCIGLAFLLKNNFFKIAFFIFPLFFVRAISLFYTIHVSHYIHDESALFEAENKVASYLKPYLKDSVFAQIAYTSTIPARLQQHVLIPQPDVFTAVTAKNPYILNGTTALSAYHKPEFYIRRKDKTDLNVYTYNLPDLRTQYQIDTVFGAIEVWKRTIYSHNQNNK